LGFDGKVRLQLKFLGMKTAGTARGQDYTGCLPSYPGYSQDDI